MKKKNIILIISGIVVVLLVSLVLMNVFSRNGKITAKQLEEIREIVKKENEEKQNDPIGKWCLSYGEGLLVEVPEESTDEEIVYKGNGENIASEYSCEYAVEKSLELYPGIIEEVNFVTEEINNVEVDQVEDGEILPEDKFQFRFWNVLIYLTEGYDKDGNFIEKVETSVDADSGELLIYREIYYTPES